MNNLTGIILAGGDSLRMGADKALVRYNNRYLIEWPIALFENICDSIIISSGNQQLRQFGYKVIADAVDYIGPIAGICAALQSSNSEHHVVIACDTPLLDEHVYCRLLDSSARYQAVVAGFRDGYMEPLVGYYRRSTLEIFQQQINNQRFKLHDALSVLNTRVELFQDKQPFLNINYPWQLDDSQVTQHGRIKEGMIARPLEDS